MEGIIGISVSNGKKWKERGGFGDSCYCFLLAITVSAKILIYNISCKRDR